MARGIKAELDDLYLDLIDGLIQIATAPVPPNEQFEQRFNALTAGGCLPVVVQDLAPGIPCWSVGEGKRRITVFIGSHPDEPWGKYFVWLAEQLVGNSDHAAILDVNDVGFDFIFLDKQGLAANDVWAVSMSDEPRAVADAYIENCVRPCDARRHGEYAGAVPENRATDFSRAVGAALDAYAKRLKDKHQQLLLPVSTHGAFFWSGPHVAQTGFTSTAERFGLDGPTSWCRGIEIGVAEAGLEEGDRPYLYSQYPYPETYTNPVEGLACKSLYVALKRRLAARDESLAAVLGEPALLMPDHKTYDSSLEGLDWNKAQARAIGNTARLVEKLLAASTQARDLLSRHRQDFEGRELLSVEMTAAFCQAFVDEQLRQPRPAHLDNRILRPAEAFTAVHANPIFIARHTGAAARTAQLCGNDRLAYDLREEAPMLLNGAFRCGHDSLIDARPLWRHAHRAGPTGRRDANCRDRASATFGCAVEVRGWLVMRSPRAVVPAGPLAKVGSNSVNGKQLCTRRPCTHWRRHRLIDAQ